MQRTDQDGPKYRAFLCHSSRDSEFAIELRRHLEPNMDGGVFCYEQNHRSESFVTTINRELAKCNVMVVVIGSQFSEWQVSEANEALRVRNQGQGQTRHIFTVLLQEAGESCPLIPNKVVLLGQFPKRDCDIRQPDAPAAVAHWITEQLQVPWLSADGLPYNPHLFDYEKDIINFFARKQRLGQALFEQAGDEYDDPDTENKARASMRQKLLDGCPGSWPRVEPWEDKDPRDRLHNLLEPETVGSWRLPGARVAAVALGTAEDGKTASTSIDLSDDGLWFHEAGPRKDLYFPRMYRHGQLNVAILVSGGIAPGINAVIDGIVQRHTQYAENHGYPATLRIYGLRNGFYAFHDLGEWMVDLQAAFTSSHANEGGSILGTSRLGALLKGTQREPELQSIVRQLYDRQIDILYVIGGDGSMKAAHAIWCRAQAYDGPGRLDHGGRKRELSVVAIPKTMDNDVLWVWQSFGFMSAVEKAREIINHLSTEVEANPRLCVVQLFGSDSGFVVSHAVLTSRARQCDVAVIPEVEFSMECLTVTMLKRILKDRRKIPYGLIVMAETAVPTDAMNFVMPPRDSPYNTGFGPDLVSPYDIGLSDEENEAIQALGVLRRSGKRIQGQTEDVLRKAGLKIVSAGLHKLLPAMHTWIVNASAQDRRSRFGSLLDDLAPQDLYFSPDWNAFRVLTNEPRHVLRAVAPSATDVIFAHRLGTLAVDNALAGYTDVMISQWLTEYVLVPLELVVLGRKRIPESGIFWKSVLAKTRQPARLVEPAPG